MNTDHLSATYSSCDRLRLIDRPPLMQVFKQALCTTETDLLETKEHNFAHGALTATMIMSGCRASLHTYPEHDICFVDLFRQDDDSRVCQLDQAFHRYLAPLHAKHRVVIRPRP